MRAPVRPVADLLGVPDDLRRSAAFLPGLAPFPARLWPVVAHLPVLDVNGALLADVAAREPFTRAPPIAAVFACDPFLRVADAAVALARAGIREVLNWPSVQAHEGESAAALAAVGYRAEAEFRTLLAFAERGLLPLAFAATRGAVDAALALGLRRLVLPSGGAWAELAGHVAVEGGEAIPWSEEPLTPPASTSRQSARPSRRMRL
jgi:predicted TIM-barrel enzyme